MQILYIVDDCGGLGVILADQLVHRVLPECEWCEALLQGGAVRVHVQVVLLLELEQQLQVLQQGLPGPEPTGILPIVQQPQDLK